MSRFSSFNPPIGLDQKMASATTRNLTLKWPHPLGGGDMKINDEHGNIMYTVVGHSRSSHDRILCDASGAQMYHLISPGRLIDGESIATDPQGYELFRIHKPSRMGTSLEASFIDRATGVPMVISVDGNKWHDTAILLRGNDVVAEFAPRRKLMRERLFTIAPGVDIPLLVGIAICFELVVMKRTARTTAFAAAA